jgi:predicted AAA+ superfamily ATPase
VKSVEAKTYLDTLADSILLKDVVKRYKVKLLQKIYELFLYMASNFTNEYTFTRLKNILNFNSTRTIENYLRYLEEAYLIFSLNRFSYKIKEQIKTPRKVYLVDNGFIQAKSFMLSQDYGRLMGNLFFQELLKKGLKVNENVFYYKTRNQKEVDFVLKEGIEIKELIQVVYDIADYNVKKREMGALIEASEELRCDNLTIITWDTKGEENIKNRKIKVIPLWQYLTA